MHFPAMFTLGLRMGRVKLRVRVGARTWVMSRIGVMSRMQDKSWSFAATMGGGRIRVSNLDTVTHYRRVDT